MGGQGGGVGETETELRQVVSEGLAASPINQVLVEESVLGWGEFELEVMRDRNDNVVIICSIENVDPMGVHTGDSVTVAPAQTLTDALYQELRDQAIRVIRAIGVETGGSNVQFGVDPESGEIVVIEMNPRVSRSSALASKATGFPIAKMAAKLAVGYALEEIPNDITRATPASFEPTIDYVVTKIPRFAFEKFPGADGQALDPHAERRRGDVDRPHLPRVLRQGAALARARLAARVPATPTRSCWRRSRRPARSASTRSWRPSAAASTSRRSTSAAWSTAGSCASSRRSPVEGDGTEGLARTYKSVDTCAAEFEAATPYYYSAHERPRPDGARLPRRCAAASATRWSSSAPAPTGSARGSSSTTAACTRR